MSNNKEIKLKSISEKYNINEKEVIFKKHYGENNINVIKQIIDNLFNNFKNQKLEYDLIEIFECSIIYNCYEIFYYIVDLDIDILTIINKTNITKNYKFNNNIFVPNNLSTLVKNIKSNGYDLAIEYICVKGHVKLFLLLFNKIQTELIRDHMVWGTRYFNVYGGRYFNFSRCYYDSYINNHKYMLNFLIENVKDSIIDNLILKYAFEDNNINMLKIFVCCVKNLNTFIIMQFYYYKKDVNRESFVFVMNKYNNIDILDNVNIKKYIIDDYKLLIKCKLSKKYLTYCGNNKINILLKKHNKKIKKIIPILNNILISDISNNCIKYLKYA